jgi:hypothetical protein
VFWEPVSITSEPNNTYVDEAILGPCIAFSILSNITFTYTMTSTALSNGQTAVSTNVQYNIGPLLDLWVLEGNSTASQFSNSSGDIMTYSRQFGSSSSLGAVDENVTHYTGAAIAERLNGSATTDGWGLGVINYAQGLLVGTEASSTTWDDNNTSAPALDNSSSTQVNHLTFRAAKRADELYDVNFATNPSYVWGGSTTTESSATYVYPKVQVAPTIIRAPFDGARWVMLQIWQQDIKGDYLNNLEVTNAGDLMYITCFPQWSGLSISQDPTFTAYTSLAGLGINAYPLAFIGLAAIPMFWLLVRKVRR